MFSHVKTLAVHKSNSPWLFYILGPFYSSFTLSCKNQHYNSLKSKSQEKCSWVDLSVSRQSKVFSSVAQCSLINFPSFLKVLTWFSTKLGLFKPQEHILVQICFSNCGILLFSNLVPIIYQEKFNWQKNSFKNKPVI